jgi:TRAP-type C4-dicarboxylate transport system substrate-binding protein
MKLVRRRVLALLVGAIAAPAIARRVLAQPQVTLRLHHVLSPSANVHTRLLAPWAKRVTQDSEGQIAIEIFPSMQLGGRPAQLYDQAREGVVDIVWTWPGLTPGRFPGLEVFELPFIADRRARVNAQAVQAFYDSHLRAEFSDTHVLGVCAQDRGEIHATRRIAGLADLRGLRLRPPTRLAGEALQALGAKIVAMPFPQMPDALAQGVIDGGLLPWEQVPAIRMHEKLSFHTEIHGVPTLQTATFILAMNKDRYRHLPDDLRAILDLNSGQAFAMEAGKMWDAQALAVEEMVRARGNSVIDLGEAETARWKAATRPVVDNWLRQAKDSKIDGEKLLAGARDNIAQFSKN